MITLKKQSEILFFKTTLFFLLHNQELVHNSFVNIIYESK